MKTGKVLGVLGVLVVCLLAGCVGPLSPIAPPDIKGPVAGVVGEELTFKLNGTDPADVHDYAVDFGDGSEIKWKAKTTWTHAYATPGPYEIKAREKCPLGLFVTNWSKPKTVTITEALP